MCGGRHRLRVGVWRQRRRWRVGADHRPHARRLVQRQPTFGQRRGRERVGRRRLGARLGARLGSRRWRALPRAGDQANCSCRVVVVVRGAAVWGCQAHLLCLIVLHVGGQCLLGGGGRRRGLQRAARPQRVDVAYLHEGALCGACAMHASWCMRGACAPLAGWCPERAGCNPRPMDCNPRYPGCRPGTCRLASWASRLRSWLSGSVSLACRAAGDSVPPPPSASPPSSGARAGRLRG